MRSLLFATALTLVASFAPAPASAEYCETIAWGEARFPDGACTRVHAAPVRGLFGSSELILMAERAPAPARAAELRRMINEVASAVGPALSQLSRVRLPATVHVVIVDDAYGDARAETVARVDGTSDCAVMLFNSAPGAVGMLARTLAHEMFHCAQYVTWPRKMALDDSRWWSEGSAEWFEDLALPGRVGDSDTPEAVRRFRSLSPVSSMLNNTYGNVVLFSWLGSERVSAFIAGLAEGGETQIAGAGRAMSESEWQSFAQDYADERITLPSGIALSGTEFGPLMPHVFETTGVAGSDPAFVSPSTAPPLTLVRGVVSFVTAHYEPTGSFGPMRAIFSERAGSWAELPNPLRPECGSRKRIKFAAIAFAPAQLRIDPRTQTTSSPACPCPVGDWTISRDDLQSLSPSPEYSLMSEGEVLLRFDRSGNARFNADKLRFVGPERSQGGVSFRVTIERSYDAAWTWRTSGDHIFMTEVEPLRVVERTTHATTGPYGSAVKTFPPRISPGTPYERSGEPQKFTCAGPTLTITPPVKNLGGGNYWVDPARELRYPRWGVFIR